MNIFVFLLLLFTSAVVYGSEKTLDIKTDKDFIYISIINNSDEPIFIYENLAINPCDFKNGLCVKSADSDSDIYLGHGGILKDKIVIAPFRIYGYVIPKGLTNFHQNIKDFKWRNITFLYYGPKGMVFKSPICKVAYSNNDFDINCL